MKLSIIIPVYNEEKLISSVIQKVIDADCTGLCREIIVVDDGSTDKSAIRVSQLVANSKHKKTSRYSLISIRLSSNQGKGAALKAGFQKSTGDILMVQDADEEYTVADYPALLEPFIKDKAKVVYGSRNKKRENFKNRYSYLVFYLGGLVLTWFINLLYGLSLTDQPTGYKLFSKDMKPLLLKPIENRFTYEVAVSATLAKNNIPFTEVPIHYKPRTMSDGKKITGWDFVKSVMVAIKYRLTD
ncbi:MAG: glycosyltransferase family 2 protein [Patescibacteria group bacterium]